ncbi:ATPase domain-containing protein [Paraburkholderia kirstenboschensis]|uniref:non-specific serine/threonine protein kinase n=1 Tax=Paraburkholderia kirstenboschensis TaxID=1245436 RepID=A0ABZ0EEY7_9BURK|nr:ATPase domain-containing protein [Paraburkholderia kirstenboschensis]WOD15039.1 ATPase domain-containing protein [Paraburkholderia kirstenboschensis]
MDHRVSTGVAGLDEILAGGLTASRVYLVEGPPGAGKTTLALQFLLEGQRQGDTGLYVTLSETATELRSVAATHGWSLDGLALVELLSDEGLTPAYQQTVLNPAELELGETVRNVMRQVEQLRPARVVFDSLSELRLLSLSPLRYRRQLLALKRFLGNRNCTVLLLDDETSEAGDVQLHSLAHGVINLNQMTHEYGTQRRRLRIVKMRGVAFQGGFHDFTLKSGGIQVFPTLVAGHRHAEFDYENLSTGVPELDALLGGGLARGTNTLLVGPSGAGKTTTVLRCIQTALERGEHAVYYLFDETLGTLLRRAAALGMDLSPHLESGLLSIQPIDPAELSPGEFTHRVQVTVETHGARVVAIDSINAYLQAMPGEKYLMLQMHELLTYLNQRGVMSLLVLGQHGIIGETQSNLDVSYLSDALLLFRFFEAEGSVLTAVSVVKSRTNMHERSIRQFRLSDKGLEVGDVLSDFKGVLSGLPSYTGHTPLLGASSVAPG